MSFGASPSDIIIVVTFCKALYRKCRTAGGEYDEIASEVRNLHTVLRHLKYETSAPESPLNQNNALWNRQLAPIIRDCDNTLSQLDGLLMKYGRLAQGEGSPTSTRQIWERVRFGSNEMDQLGGLRVKLISHKTSLSLFLDTIQLKQSGRMSTTLEGQGEQLDVILDKVDKIASKMQSRGGSVLTSYDDDDREVWKQFRRELVAEGFDSRILEKNKDVLRAYIREIDTQGLLDPVAVDSEEGKSPVTPHTERWVESVKAPSVGSSTLVGSESVSKSFDSLDTPTDEQSSKAMFIQEENLKFPSSMKQERPRPESKLERSTRQLALPPPKQSADRRLSEGTQALMVPASRPMSERRLSGPMTRQLSPAPRIVTSSADEKDLLYVNTDGTTESDSESDTSSRRSRSPMDGQIITTNKLIAISQALAIRSHSASSFKSHNSYFDDRSSRNLEYRSKLQIEYGSSPQTGPVPIPSQNNKSNAPLGNPLQAEPIRLAPDSQGKEIPLDAKWTKISRRLVSPEVLHQMHKRYEARPEFVAVLGVLSRAEIEDLAARSEVLREVRRRRHFPPDVPPPQPPRPHSSQNIRGPPPRDGRDTPSDEEEDTSSSEEESARRRERRVKPKGILKNRNPNYSYERANSYGAMPPSPVWSPGSMERDRTFLSESRSHDRPRSRHEDREYRDKERERESRRKHHHSSHREKEREREKDREKENEKKRKHWKGHLTAAGIGGAAASLVNVLTEAASGL